MTTPDPTPYLLPTDLRTAEDAVRRFEELSEDGIMGPPPARVVAQCLRARLDRERRQACRRGALEEWRTFACAARLRHNAWTCDVCADTLSRALAFRAAARLP